MRVERVADSLRALDQCLGCARRQGNHEAGLRRQRHRPEPGLRRPVLAHHAVPVGAAEAEGVASDHHGMVGERLAFRLHLHGARVEFDLRIGHLKALRRRRECAPLHHQDDLEQGAVERSGLHVPDVALDAGNPQRNLTLESAIGLGDGVALDAVAHLGSGRMGFDIVEVQRGAASPGRGLAHQLNLGVTGRRADEPAWRQTDRAISRAGRVHRRRLDHGVDRVSVPFGGRQGLDGEDERSFGTHVAVGRRIEGMADTLRADVAHEIEAAAHPAAAQIGDGADERLFAIATRERIHRCVQGAQAGGAGRAIGGRRPHEVEVVRNPVGQHGKADAGYRILRDTMLRPPVGHGGNLRADKDAGGAIAQ